MPDFLGERQPFFLSMPENMGLWEKYNEARKKGLSKRDKGLAAINFYKKHGFRLLSEKEKNRLLKIYWSIPERQIETSIVLASKDWKSN